MAKEEFKMPFRGKVVFGEAKKKEDPPKDKEEREAELARILEHRERGRRVEGRGIVPFEILKQELEAKKKAQNGVLNPDDEAELRELTLRLDGPLLERARNKREKKIV